MQTKPFVVEHKASRRRDHAEPQSIWGNLDLAAVAEDVASDMPAEQNASKKRDSDKR